MPSEVTLDCPLRSIYECESGFTGFYPKYIATFEGIGTHIYIQDTTHRTSITLPARASLLGYK